MVQVASYGLWLPIMGRCRHAASPSLGLAHPRQVGGWVGARRNEGRDPAQRLSGCIKGMWITSTVSFSCMVRGGGKGNPEAHISVMKNKSMLDRLGVTIFMAVVAGCLLFPDDAWMGDDFPIRLVGGRLPRDGGDGGVNFPFDVGG